ncbi:anhydro-N-acetylmuramic acid kinase [Sinorhizobium alkalisoli]|uniref:Anhydro-N-acetylmuramic acid kinase n=1 Tax=Sinorhizobium alkalisoli TaxID=1752398 RepID=A0A1E3VD67_9HYPH|nr:anhydro-N-acetylmuramic acid kinase [Sinorhizobium alkalisoli]MCA1492304.1 anhydro-N-acetylmuramic acid kinase [Ensifer sp. NBAIM29]MCG5479289.1 anhydro-N-acetylmuramic acid kinase [Sinorhizobium alkalisoli]ODR91474.1 anhydro-N-acetylmuramic acid kinase [Sinorhizobium alkalisoli]QFI66411.1 Anhydro-N-acetylmuramic acid kinase [Sinorhizobium alkalisoli]
MGRIWTAIGLMSGTSMDGIDVALIRTDGDSIVERGPSAGYAYDPAFRQQLKQGLEDARAIEERRERPGILAELERDLTVRHVGAVKAFLRDNNMLPENIDVAGFHGQTVLHRPAEALTVQIGDGELLAKETRIDVVYDMRANDMAHGGQGAPLIPAYHAVLARGLAEREAIDAPIVFVNIGGISNLTYIGAGDELVAYDSGPGNTLIDQWVEAHAGIPYDQGGMIASEGTILPQLLDRYLLHPFFTAEKRRSLDRSDFAPPAPSDASLEDGARTLARVTAAAIIRSARHLPSKPATYIVCGGGRLNLVIMRDLAALAAEEGGRVFAAEALELNGDSMEAEAWAYLAVRSLRRLPLTYPGTTGVERPMSGGRMAAKPANPLEFKP